jgi:dihydrolipoamide dehydrogenase
MQKFDAVVIGAGPGGYVCAIKLGQLGIKTAIIEKEYLGGVCLNVGCIPSKALIHAGNFYDKIKNGHAKELGINVEVKSFNLKELITWKNKIVQKLTSGIEMLLKANKVEIIRGEAKFLNSNQIEVKTLKNESLKIESKYFVIATGSSPVSIPGFEPDGKNIITSTEALSLEETPKHLCVIGGGYIGLELGTFYSKLGSQVTVLEASSKLLSTMDQDCVNVVARNLKKRNVEIILEAKAKSWKKTKSKIELTYIKDNKEVSLETDLILLTIGRKPNSKNLDIEKAGLKPNEKGFIDINKQCQTKVPNIFAIGDVAGGMLLAHKASKEGIVAASQIAGLIQNNQALKSTIFDTTIIPAVVFTDPEIAAVGYTLEEAKQNGFVEAHQAQFPFAALGKALASGESDGFVKIVADKKTGLLLGFHIVGADASSLLGEAGLALELKSSVEDLALTIHAHPTLPEALMECAEVALGHPIHIVKK